MKWELILGPSDTSPIDVHEMDLPLPGLRAGLAGLRIATVSDLHFGRFAHENYTRRVVREIMARRPDMILLLGDMINGQPSQQQKCARLIAPLIAPMGVIGILGNHEHYSGWCKAAQAYRQIGVDILINEHRVIRRDGAAVILAGIDDHGQGKPSITAALDGADRDLPTILLSHNPDEAEHVPQNVHVDVMLCGHTHGGQIVPFGKPILTQTSHRRYWTGWVEGPRCRVYINRGVGFVGLPIRLNCRPEIPIFKLAALEK